jgi:hypothetical protein
MTRFSQVQRKLLILISRDRKLWISHISSKSLKSISETEGCTKMNIKCRERKRNEKGSAEMNLWTKSTGQVKPGGTGFPKPVAPVSVGSKRIRPVTHPTVTHSPPLSPHDPAQ